MASGQDCPRSRYVFSVAPHDHALQVGGPGGRGALTAPDDVLEDERTQAGLVIRSGVVQSPGKAARPGHLVCVVVATRTILEFAYQ